MALLTIRTWPDPVLRRPAEALPEGPAAPDLRQLAADMLDTMYAARGRGLAAPQVGRSLRVFVMDAGWKDGRPEPRVVVNPDILWSARDVASGPEGCLSIPGVSALVTRPAQVRLRWADLDGGRHEANLAGFEAVCVQHEIDHLDGLVTLDRVDPVQRAALVAAYDAARA